MADAGEDSEIRREVLFVERLDATREDRGRAFGANGDGHGISVNDGGCDEITVFEVIDDVDQRAASVAEFGDAGVFSGVFGRAINEGGAKGIAPVERALDQGETLFVCPSLDLGVWVGTIDGNAGFGLENQAQLGHGGFGCAANDHAATA